MLVALTVTPALSLLLLSRAPLERGDAPPADGSGVPSPGPLRSSPGRAGRTWRSASPSLGLAVLTVLVGIDDPVIQGARPADPLGGAPGTSHPEMSRITELVSQELRSLPGVRNVGAHVGRAVTSDQMVGINSGEVWVSIDPNADYEQTVGRPGRGRWLPRAQPRSADLSRSSGSGVGVATCSPPDRHRRPGRLTGAANDPLVVRVTAQDLRSFAARRRRCGGRLRGRGVVDPCVELPVEEPTVEIEVESRRRPRLGIKPGDIRRAAAALLLGRGRQPLRASRRCSRWWCGHARDAQQPDQRPGAPDRYARAADTSARRTSPTCASRRTDRDQARRASRATSMSPPTCAVATSTTSPATSRAARAARVPARIPRRDARRVRERQADERRRSASWPSPP